MDARDIGRVVAAVFTSPGQLRKAHTLCGEQSLSYHQVASIRTEVLGRPFRYAGPSESEYLGALASEGAPQDYLDARKKIHRVMRMNVFALPKRTVRRLTGAPATPFARFERDYAHPWQDTARQEGAGP